jgi:hypothetical protein
MSFKSRQLKLCLAAGLAIHVSRSFAQEEDYAGYRHEFYREDDHRMSVDTDTIAFDVGLGAKARLNGAVVVDAISGATPTGAPPQKQWPFPTLNNYYNRAYNQLFQAAINDPNNLILYQSGYFANYQSYTNYIAQNNPQLGTQANNNALAAYRALTNSPSYRSTQVPLVHLQDTRVAFSLGAPFFLGIHTLTPQVAYSTESDYRSLALSLNYAIALNKKNTTLNAGWAHNFDRVRDDTLVNWQHKNSDAFLVGVNQLLDPKSYFTLQLTLGQETGYLSDPYRGVMAVANFPQLNPEDAALIPENRPRYRSSEVLYAAYQRFIDPLNGAIELGYRFYHDSYGVFGNTFEAAWHQKLGRNLVLSPAFRYYRQTAADFYYIVVPDFNNLPRYYSADYRLSELQSFNASVNLSYQVLRWCSLDVGYSRYIMQGLDGATSQSAYPSANVYTVGGRFWF